MSYTIVRFGYFKYLGTSIVFQLRCFQLQVIETLIPSGFRIRRFIILIKKKSRSMAATGLANSVVQWHDHGFWLFPFIKSSHL